MKGWVKLYRKLQDSPIFGDPVLLKLFILCLLKANHKPNKVFLDGVNQPIQVAAGQFITGRNRLTTNKNDKEYIKNEKEKMPVAKPKNDFTAGILHTEDFYDPSSEEWANLLRHIKKNSLH